MYRNSTKAHLAWNVSLLSGVLLSVVSASASAADGIPGWCQAIRGGAFCAAPTAKPPAFCGEKKVTLAWADGFADNPWRQLSAAEAINEASQCPNVTSWTHTDGQGSTQKAISDLEGLAARGVDAIVVFADTGPAMLPAIRTAFKQGSTVVPFRNEVGGQPGTDYSVFVGTNFYQDGVNWATWLAKTLNGHGTVAYLGGPPGSSQSLARAAGIEEVLKHNPGIQWIGQRPFIVTNWNPSIIQSQLAALIAKYPKIDGLMGDLDVPIVTSGVFQRAGRPLPLVAGEGANAFGCLWKKMHADDPKSTFQFMTDTGNPFNIRLAVRWAIAKAAGGKLAEPLVVTDAFNKQHVVTPPNGMVVENFEEADSLKGEVPCNPDLPPSGYNTAGLTVQQQLQALKGGL